MCQAGQVPQAIKNRYRELERAMNRVDFKAFQTFFAPEFVSVSPEGKTTKREDFFKEIKPLFDGATRAEAKEKLISATTSGGLVKVKFDFQLDLIGKTETTRVHEAGVDVWKKIKGKWLFVKTVDSLFTVTPLK